MIINNQAEAANVASASHKVNTVLVRSDGRQEPCEEEIVAEHFLDLIVNEQLVAKLVCTPSNLAELVVGRLITEQLITGMQDLESLYICEEGNKAKVFLKKNVEAQLKRVLSEEPTCCTGNKVFLKNVANQGLQQLPRVEWEREWIFALARSFANGSHLHKATKGTHSCYLSVKGEVQFAVEDIGRHNALDKAIGYAVMNGYPLQDCILFTSGRVPTDMVQKVVAAGVPILVSKAVPTDAAVEMARHYGLTLLCRAWPDSFEVY